VNDFLARLAGRARHDSPVLRPLSPSLFGPAIFGAANQADMKQTKLDEPVIGATETAKVAPSRHAVRESFHRGPSFATLPDPLPAPERESPVESDVPKRLDEPAVHRKQVTPVVKEATRLPFKRTPDQADEVEQITMSRPQERRAPQHQEYLRLSSEDRGPASSLLEIIGPTAETASTAAPVSQSSERQSDKQLPSHQQEDPSAALRQIRPLKKLESVVESSGPAQPPIQGPLTAGAELSGLATSQVRSRVEIQTKPASSSTAVPEINVTIGRIEVRAVSAPVPIPTAPPPSKPRLSLDDYLRSRNQGAS
jgi:hypothetical protein